MLKVRRGEIKDEVGEDRPQSAAADFVMKLEMRCALLEAQSNYADAIRERDLHWAAMSGFRVGQMYPVTAPASDDDPAHRPREDGGERQAALLLGSCIVRYRALDKGSR